jgi:hypothetical protein
MAILGAGRAGSRVVARKVFRARVGVGVKCGFPEKWNSAGR